MNIISEFVTELFSSAFLCVPSMALISLVNRALIFQGSFYILTQNKSEAYFLKEIKNERHKRNQRHGRMSFRNLDATKAPGNGYAGNLLGNG